MSAVMPDDGRDVVAPGGHSWGEHVGEVELRLSASDEVGVFAAAVDALGEMLADDSGDAREWVEIEAEGTDRAVLLAAWLEELIFLAEHDGIIPVAVRDVVLEPARIRAAVGGYRGAPPHLVKAVTYHRLAFEPHEGGWRATVVLDV
jgi:SHS2 domain-containing protein